MIFSIVTARILHTNQKKILRKLYFCTAIKFTYLYSLALTWKIEHEGGKRPKTSLRGTSIQKYEIAQNCPFFPSLPSFFPRWSHFIVLKNLRWSLEMYSEVIVSSYFHSVSQSCPILSTNCTFRKWFYVCFVYFAAIAQEWWINLRSFIFFYTFFYTYVVKGESSPTWLRNYQEEEEQEAAKRAIKESEMFVS